jgi:phi13 family phage major tail protein
MPINAGTAPVVGLKNVVYALLTKDDATGVVYGPVKPLVGAMTAKITPKVSSTPISSDDAVSEMVYFTGTTSIEFQQKNIPLEAQAEMLGHLIVAGVMIRNSADIAPEIAMGYMSKKNNGAYEYDWYFKGKLEDPAKDHESLGEKVTPKYKTLKGEFYNRIFDGNASKQSDTDSVNYVASIGANWFTSVEQTADVIAPTITTTVPATGATTVSRTSTFVWTFSESLLPSLVTPDNFYLVSTVDGSIVAANVVYNDTNKTVTLTPTAQLAATTKYLAIADSAVTDLAGNRLVQVNETFTTVA